MWTVCVKGIPTSKPPSGRYPGAMTEATYSVTGMSCDHCVQAVKSEVGKVTGVASVTVDLDAGRVTVVSDEPIDAAAVRAAVEEAGFSLAG